MKKIGKIFTILIAVLLFFTSVSSMASSTRSIDNIFIQKKISNGLADSELKVSSMTKKSIGALHLNLLEKLSEIFPRIFSLPLFKKLLFNQDGLITSNSPGNEGGGGGTGGDGNGIGYVEGHVYEYKDESWQLLEGATVSTDENSSVTDSNGYYYIVVVDPGTHILTCSKDEYITETTQVFVNLDHTSAKQNFYLSSPAYLEGYVYTINKRDNSKIPMSGVTVTTATSADPGATIETDSTGHYTLTIGSGYVNVVTTSKKGYYFERKSISVNAYHTATLNFNLIRAEEGDGSGDPCGWITGHVYDAETGDLIPKAGVSVWGAYLGATDDNGHYLFEIPFGPGCYDASASAGGYKPDIHKICNSGKTITQDFYLQHDNNSGSDGNSSCFLKGTKIEMADGSLKNIEEIEIGDLVQSFDMKNKMRKVGVVSKVFHHSPKEMTDYYLIINDELRVTPNHPIYVNNKWITAGELKIGDRFGETIHSIEKVYQRVPTYNFEVLPYHTYNVIWGEHSTATVHNSQEYNNLTESHDWHDDYPCADKA